MKKQLHLIMAFIITASFSITGLSATLIITNGELVGATGVLVDGAFYDVAFKDGSCVSLYNGCDDASDFIFAGNTASQAASEALLAQVFIGIYDDDPWLTAGCEDSKGCNVRTYDGLVVNGQFAHANAARNRHDQSQVADGTISGSHDPLEDTIMDATRTVAVWTPAAVPVPAAGWLFAATLMSLAGLGRREKARTSV